MSHLIKFYAVSNSAIFIFGIDFAEVNFVVCFFGTLLKVEHADYIIWCCVRNLLADTPRVQILFGLPPICCGLDCLFRY